MTCANADDVPLHVVVSHDFCYSFPRLHATTSLHGANDTVLAGSPVSGRLHVQCDQRLTQALHTARRASARRAVARIHEQCSARIRARERTTLWTQDLHTLTACTPVNRWWCPLQDPRLSNGGPVNSTGVISKHAASQVSTPRARVLAYHSCLVPLHAPSVSAGALPVPGRPLGRDRAYPQQG